jgi:kinesin family member C1
MQRIQDLTQKQEKANQEIIEIDLKLNSFGDRKQHAYFFYKRFLHNQMQELKGNIRVFCRVRPPLEGVDSPKDFVFEKGLDELMRFPDLQSIEVNADPEDAPSARNKKSNNAMTSQMFKFDAVFSQDSDQYDIFKEVSELVVSALDGYKVCIFAYGQTGSGKTYTMEGDYGSKDKKGIIPRAVEILFQNIEGFKEMGWEFTVKVNFQEIYLEEIRDLLSPSNSMRYMNKGNKYEPTVVEVEQAEDVYVLLNKARENRIVAETQCNQHSSRSHSLFQLQIKGFHSEINGGAHIDGALNLIDLAGSERLHKSKAEGDRLKEAMSINKSLSCLGNVITALANKDKHIPYRDSKLTYILKDHIGSQSAKTLMIVNISPLATHLIESVNSLRFASKVNSCIINSRKHE